MLKTIMLIDALPLAPDITNKIIMDVKYNALQNTFNKRSHDLNRHFLYYCWLNKKLCKRGEQQTLLKTILEFDYYKPNKLF